MQHYKVYTLVLLLFSILSYASLEYIDFLKLKKDTFEAQTYKVSAQYMQESLAQMIEVKQKSTAAIAISLAHDKDLINKVATKENERYNFQELSAQFREHTLYKNIWVQIFDSTGEILYRSWSDEQKENLYNLRQDLQNVIATKQVVTSISAGRHSFSIRAIVPLFQAKKFVGMIEIVSHFNSISKSLAKSDVCSIVLLKKEYTKQLKYPMTRMFIDDYYIANFDAPKHMQNYLQDKGIENYFHDGYKVEDGKILVSYPLKDIRNDTIGYYIMCKKLSNISTISTDFYMFKWIALSAIVFMGIVIVISIFLYFAKARDKDYYRNIIDRSSNIIIINSPSETIEVNKTFFHYFKEFFTFKEFQIQHRCISELFIEEEGCLSRKVDGKHWLHYLMQNTGEKACVKIELGGDMRYFSITASLVSPEKEHFAIIMSDITQQENYKQELEHLTITDALTGIGNRRYFQTKIEEECARASRYNNTLSLIVFDIDHFKDVNDEYGHSVGDEVLKEYTKLIASHLRENDIFCRIGGEEFIVLLLHVDAKGALKIAEKLREEIQKSQKVVPITMSFGVSEYIYAESEESLFKRADKALYKAKELGRNRVELA